MMTKKELNFFYWGFVSIICIVAMLGFYNIAGVAFAMIFMLLFAISFCMFAVSMSDIQKELKKNERKTH
jgi:hypothetical protein